MVGEDEGGYRIKGKGSNRGEEGGDGIMGKNSIRGGVMGRGRADKTKVKEVEKEEVKKGQINTNTSWPSLTLPVPYQPSLALSNPL